MECCEEVDRTLHDALDRIRSLRPREAVVAASFEPEFCWGRVHGVVRLHDGTMRFITNELNHLREVHLAERPNREELCLWVEELLSTTYNSFAPYIVERELANDATAGVFGIVDELARLPVPATCDDNLPDDPWIVSLGWITDHSRGRMAFHFGWIWRRDQQPLPPDKRIFEKAYEAFRLLDREQKSEYPPIWHFRVWDLPDDPTPSAETAGEKG